MHVGSEWGQPIGDQAFQNLSGIINAHPGVRITHAHCAGNTDDATIEQWLRVPGAGYNENSFVDSSACLKFYRDAPMATRELIVWRFRKWGIDRLLMGSDYLQFLPEETPRQAIETLKQYPFTAEELNVILSNDGTRWLEPPVVDNP
jgi:predicted TIM-barrel fold metal-dependent hydrolase